MRCEEFEAIVFSGGEVTEAMREHAQSCEACRVLLNNADVLTDAAHMDDGLEVPDSFSAGWRAAIRREASKEKQPTLLERAKTLLAGGNRRVARALAYALCAVALVGVGAQLGDRAPVSEAYSLKATRAMGNSAMDGGVMMTSVAYDEAAEEESGAAEERKIIRTAQLDLEVGDVDDVMHTITLQVEQAGGVISYSEVNGKKGEGRFGSMEVQVPSEQLSSFLKGAGSLGMVTRQSSQQTDMTTQYHDNASRLASAMAQKQRLDELYAQAEDMADVVAITDALFEVQQEIDNLTGANQYIDNRVAMSRVYVALSEADEEETRTFWDEIAAHFADGFGAIGSFFSGAVLMLVWALPWAALIAAAAGVILLIKKHRK